MPTRQSRMAVKEEAIKAKVKGVITAIKRLDVQHGKPIEPITRVRDTVTPLCFVTVLFFGWGFAYGLLDTMNAKVKTAMGLSQAQAALLAVSYYSAYLFMPFFVAGPIVRKAGYRLALIVGLLLFGLGNFVVSLGAQAVATGGPAYLIMILGMLVVGSGIATLERSANTYVTHIGPVKWSALRLNLAQSGAAAGTVVAPLLAAAVIFETQSEGLITGIVKRNTRANEMASVVGLYRTTGTIVLGITLLFGMVFFRTKWVPEVPVDPHAIEGQESQRNEHNEVGRLQRFRKHAIWKEDRLWWGVVANFMNLGCQVAVAQYFIPYCAEVANMSHAKGAHMLSIAQAAFLMGRLGMALLCRCFKERSTLLLFIFGAMACTTAAAFAPGIAGIVCAIMIMFFEAPLFPTIFATASVVHDEHSSLREDIMIASISGGAMLSPLAGALADGISKARGGKGTATAFNLITGGFTVVASYILAINTKRRYKKIIDDAQKDEGKGDTDLASSTLTELRVLPSSAPCGRENPGKQGSQQVEENQRL